MSQIVLVTGCSSGFGELIAQTLARAGHHVFATMRGIADRNLEAAEKFHQLAAAEQLALDVVEMDVASDASVARGVDQVIAQAERIDVVVNNAGTSSSGPLEAFSADQMAALLNVNALGPMRVNKAVLGRDARATIRPDHLDEQHARARSAGPRRSLSGHEVGCRGACRNTPSSDRAVRRST